jgi:hypothetical protein
MKPRFVGDPLAGRWSAQLKFRPPGLWLGVWWCRPARWELEIRVCLIPGLPLSLYWLGPEPARLKRLIEQCRGRREAP